jgi:hypothetical protein
MAHVLVGGEARAVVLGHRSDAAGGVITTSSPRRNGDAENGDAAAPSGSRCGRRVRNLTEREIAARDAKWTSNANRRV